MLYKSISHSKLTLIKLSMDNIGISRSVLTTPNFGLRDRAFVLDICCVTLSRRANIPKKVFDTGITNLHKVLYTAPDAQHIQLNIVRFIHLRTIHLHFLDYIKCASVLTVSKITALTVNQDSSMKQ